MTTKDNTLHIANMVCDRCIEKVEEIALANELMIAAVNLGEVQLKMKPTEKQYHDFKVSLDDSGFSLIVDQETMVINQIKTIIIEHINKIETAVHDESRTLKDIINAHMILSYSRAAALFSDKTGYSLTDYYKKLRMERAKEYLLQEKYNISEIADLLGFTHLQYFSTQFKLYSGYSPKKFQRLKPKVRIPLDKI